MRGMEILADIGPDSWAEPYDEPRGTCPECGSGRVRHHVAGAPMGEAMNRQPKWVRFHGCLPPVQNRECRACRVTWSVEG